MSALSCIAYCWRIERRDGIAIGLTTHDRDLTIDGMTYRAAPGMTPSAIERHAGLEADTMDVRGSLTSAAIGEADLLAGRWDGAWVRLFAVDWEMGAIVAPLGAGRIGAVELGEDGFTAELAGASAALDRAVVEETSAACRAELGDRRCRVAMAARRRFARVVAIAERVVTLDAAEPVAGAYAGGVLRWFGGANGGLVQAIDASAGSTVTLRAPPVFAVGEGVLVELGEGCDKRFATCAGRFANAANFRGEPHLPGMDLLTRYSGG
ncbi:MULTISPECIES: DUF2163 domain-containing protein [unclassified Sphingomonas]|uniref:DUF2163 domain-containing protein n=1 Tax=unclassified Sphingomonas TaxID=196159 RepID=UPI00045275FF|nr:MULTISPECIES: DUF2163 domain-containing protein [unclassified Sphingomonas]EZP50108.1 hypothetical protein BW41_03224 [Sphingomonas sp. RIT328]